jgi:hypothetical protein
LPDTLTIAARFCGPPATGNGGYIAGRLASYLSGPVEVTLRRPAPLDRTLAVECSEPGAIVLRDGAAVVAEARAAPLTLEPPAAPHLAAAEAAAKSYLGFTTHGASACFVCGPARAVGDGLRIFAGPLADRNAVAAPWRPDAAFADGDGDIRPEFVWGALDCPGAFALMGRRHRPMLLGRLTARLEGRIHAGERCVVLAWPIAAEGRKQFAGSAVFTEDGELRGLAQSTWFEVEGYGGAP